MKKNSPLLLMAALVATASTGYGQYTSFNDTFGNGSTLNGTSITGGSPGNSSTSYDIASSKATACTITNGNLQLTLAAATGSGFLEAQALFSSFPIEFFDKGDYMTLTCTFTNVSGLLQGGSGSSMFVGLYNSGGAPPVAGELAQSGLSDAADSTYATGNAQLWQGYVGEILSTQSKLYTRPLQPSVSTNCSAVQDLIGNNFGGGAYGNTPETIAGTNGVWGSGNSWTGPLVNSNQYTLTFTITESNVSTFFISLDLYSSASASGSVLTGVTNVFGGVSYMALDGLAIGVRTTAASGGGPSTNFVMDITSITISDNLAPLPGPIVPSFGQLTWVQGSGLQLSFTGSLGQSYRLWGSTNLLLVPITNKWTSLNSGTFGLGSSTFIDTQAVDLPNRYYFITSP